jgi:DNA replication and repair protein RecF
LHISSLRLQNFRNYPDNEVRFCEGSNLVLGDNGQGKTNLLEAVFVLSTSKSFRHITDRKLTRWDTDGYCLAGEFHKEGGEILSLSLAYRDRVKSLTINGSREERISAIIGKVYSVLVSFEDIALVTGPPVGRRAFLDLVLATTDPLYFSTLKAYYQAVKQKNSYLSRTGEVDEELVRVWNDQIVQNGSHLLCKRLAFVEFINRYLYGIRDALKQFSEPVRIEYRSSVGDLSGLSGEVQMRDRFDETLVSGMDRELKMRQAAYGPHRDDFAFCDDRAEMRSFGSVGEARFTSIVLKLAQAAYYLECRGVRPIMLLDDVLLELDGTNRERVLTLFRQDHQFIVTTTERSRMPKIFSPERVFHITEGSRISLIGGRNGR